MLKTNGRRLTIVAQRLKLCKHIALIMKRRDGELWGRLTYSYKQKYIFGASVRRDGSSKFGKGKPWGDFPGS